VSREFVCAEPAAAADAVGFAAVAAEPPAVRPAVKRLRLLLVSLGVGVAMTYIPIAVWTHAAYFHQSADWLTRLGAGLVLLGFPMWWTGYGAGIWQSGGSGSILYLPFVFNVVVWGVVVYALGALILRVRERKSGARNEP
jgi:hypothetical protein